jgi:hypothetical protein
MQIGMKMLIEPYCISNLVLCCALTILKRKESREKSPPAAQQRVAARRMFFDVKTSDAPSAGSSIVADAHHEPDTDSRSLTSDGVQTSFRVRPGY